MITCRQGNNLNIDEAIGLYGASTLGERRQALLVFQPYATRSFKLPVLVDMSF